MGNYRRGADFERAVKQELEERGLFVIRSAGSKSVVDLVGVSRRDEDAGSVYLIQCKYGSAKVSNKELRELLWLAQECKCVGLVVTRPQRGVVEVRNVSEIVDQDSYRS